MKFRSLFYDSSINLRSISRKRLLASILLGVLSALVIYSFFFVLSESFRVISTGFDRVPNIISKENRLYYNLFFASLSVVFGNSITFNFLFSRPQRVTHRFNSKRKRLLNDNIFLSFNFSYWFAKLGLSFGIFSMCCLEFEFLPYFKDFSFLLIVVLYLESFKSFSFFLKNSQRLKFMFAHVLLISFLSFGLSQIDVVNYKGIDKAMLKNNPIIDLPFSKFYDQKGQDYRYPWIQVKLGSDSAGRPIFFSDKIKYTYSELPNFVIKERYSFREELSPFITIEIEANKESNIYNIKLFEEILSNMNIRRVVYSVRTNDTLYGKYERRGIKKRILPFNLVLNDSLTNLAPPPPSSYNDWINDRIKDTIIISFGDNISIKNRLVSKENLKTELMEHYSPSTLFLYQFNLNTSYQDFIDVYSAHVEFVEELRKEEQKIPDVFKFRNPSEAFRAEQEKLKEKYPLFISERFNSLTP